MSEEMTPYPISRHRPEPLQLPEDNKEAVALALAVIRGADRFNSASAIEALSKRVSKLSNSDGCDSLDELTAHLPVLEALFLRFTNDAMSAGLATNKSILIRMALAAQNNYSRTVALIEGLKLQRVGRASVLINHDGGML